MWFYLFIDKTDICIENKSLLEAMLPLNPKSVFVRKTEWKSKDFNL